MNCELKRHVALVGMMGVGKTTVGRLVAAELGWPLWDSDEVLEHELGETARSHAARHGLDRLHTLEGKLLGAALAASSPTVLAPAASVADHPELLTSLAEAAVVVWLRLDAERLAGRMGSGDHRRPLAEGEMTGLLEARAGRLSTVADAVLDGGRSPTELAGEVVALVGG